MSGFDLRWLGLPLMMAMFMIMAVWIYVSVRYVNYIESLLPNSSMVSGNKKIFGRAGLLGKIMRTGSVSLLLSMRSLCVRKGVLDFDDVKKFPERLRCMLVGLWFVQAAIFLSLLALWGWLRFVGK